MSSCRRRSDPQHPVHLLLCPDRDGQKRLASFSALPSSPCGRTGESAGDKTRDSAVTKWISDSFFLLCWTSCYATLRRDEFTLKILPPSGHFGRSGPSGYVHTLYGMNSVVFVGWSFSRRISATHDVQVCVSPGDEALLVCPIKKGRKCFSFCLFFSAAT